MRDIRAFNPVGKSFTHLLVCVSLAHVNVNVNVNVVAMLQYRCCCTLDKIMLNVS